MTRMALEIYGDGRTGNSEQLTASETQVKQLAGRAGEMSCASREVCARPG